MSRRSATRLYAVAGLALGTAAFLRGNYLLGADVGVLYAVAAGGLVGLFARTRTTAGAVVTVAFALAAGGVLTWPTAVNPNLRRFIEKQANDRAMRAELAAVFASDPAFRDLSVSSVQLKVVNVTIRGSLNTRADFRRLRSRIAEGCPTLRQGFLHWDVLLRESWHRIQELDRDVRDVAD